jgi:protein SCO1/2
MERRSGAEGATLRTSGRAGSSDSWLSTAFATMAVTLAAVICVWATTLGLRGFTSETLRRLRVAEHPPLLSSLLLRSASDESVAAWDGPVRPPVQLVTFMYTRCPAVCSTIGMDFSRLQREIVSDPRARDVRLLSISFDPVHDDRRALHAYASRHGVDAAHWRVTAPEDGRALSTLLREAGVVVIGDGHGGFVHNAAIHIVRSDGRLLRIFGVEQYEAALEWARSYRE